MSTPPMKFCLMDLSFHGPNGPADRTLKAIADNVMDAVNHHLGEPIIAVRYINEIDNDPGSDNYNPDGTIGRFEVFRSAKPSAGLTFGDAIEALKKGARVSRSGWNGKGMFLFLLPAADGISTRVIHDPSLRAVIESEVGGETFDALGSIRMFTADKKILTGWLASQSDMLAEDWTITE